jgi:hypothetical protein
MATEEKVSYIRERGWSDSDILSFVVENDMDTVEEGVDRIFQQYMH